MSPTPRKPADAEDRLDRLEAAVAQIASDFYAVSGTSRRAIAANLALASLLAMHAQPAEPTLGAPLTRWGGV